MEEQQAKQVDWVTQVITLLATLNTIAIAFGVYHFDSAQLNALDAGISAIGAVVGNILTHRK